MRSAIVSNIAHFWNEGMESNQGTEAALLVLVPLQYSYDAVAMPDFNIVAIYHWLGQINGLLVAFAL